MSDPKDAKDPKSPEELKDAVEQAKQQLLGRFRWKTVEMPRVWRLRMTGETLVGYYGGQTLRNGSYGQYAVALIHVPLRGAMLVSGTEIIQLIGASMAAIGAPVQIVFNGLETTSKGHEMKRFDLKIGEGEPIQPALLLQIQH